MIKPGALVMAAVMAAVSAGTYFGLSLLPPGLIPPPIGRVPPAPAHAIAQNTAIVSSGAVPVAAPAAPAPAAETPAAAPTEQELAEEPVPKPVAAAEPATAPAPAPAPKAESKPQAASAPTPSPEPAGAPHDSVVKTPKAKPAEVAQAAPAAPASPATPAPAAQENASHAEPVAAPKKPPAESDAIKQWWPDPAKLPANQLKLVYAGDVQGESAIGLLFSDPPGAESLKQHAHVRDVSGADVAGSWETGKNPRLVVYRGLTAGSRYTVILDRELADAKGFALGQTLQGPVYIPAR